MRFIVDSSPYALIDDARGGQISNRVTEPGFRGGHMSEERVIAVDLASVYETPEKDGLIRILAWGDRVEVEEENDEHVRVKTTKFLKKLTAPSSRCPPPGLSCRLLLAA
jgi:hypothetical protein